MLFDLSGKVALVAGGAGYFGQSICTSLMDQGAAVMVADLKREQAGATAERLAAAGGKARGLALDVADAAACRTAVSDTVAAFGRLDILVNAAYFSVGKRVEDLSPEEFDRANHVNITSFFVLAREAAQAMGEGGSIVMFTSMYGQVAPDPRIYQPPMAPNPIEYGAGKAGIIQMTKYLAVAWGPRNIRVNAISPGPFPHPAMQQQDPDFIRRLAAKVPLGRIGRQNEVAGAVVYLASDASSYVTGITLNIDGGWTAW